MEGSIMKRDRAFDFMLRRDSAAAREAFNAVERGRFMRSELVYHGLSVAWQRVQANECPPEWMVNIEQSHGTDWKLIEYGCYEDDVYVHPYDRHYASYRSTEGYRADYFNDCNQWYCGAN
jgi:hypothetical protein